MSTSASDTVDVRAATTSRKKNSIDHSCVNGICMKISGNVANTRVAPSVEPVIPKAFTAGNMVSPISIATTNTKPDTVKDVRPNRVEAG